MNVTPQEPVLTSWLTNDRRNMFHAAADHGQTQDFCDHLLHRVQGSPCPRSGIVVGIRLLGADLLLDDSLRLPRSFQDLSDTFGQLLILD